MDFRPRPWAGPVTEEQKEVLKMKYLLFAILSGLALVVQPVFADEHVEDEIRQLLLEGNAYTAKNLKGQDDNYSKDGALEFWSSGGLLQEVDDSGRPEAFDDFNIEAKHIQVISLADGNVAVAHYYSEGSMKPKGSPAVGHYLTRVSQVFVKEDGEWKVRSSHWSPVTGGSGTSQTALE